MFHAWEKIRIVFDPVLGSTSGEIDFKALIISSRIFPAELQKNIGFFGKVFFLLEIIVKKKKQERKQGILGQRDDRWCISIFKAFEVVAIVVRARG